jgi:hypothetical protein
MAHGIKEAIYTRALDPTLNRGGGLRHFLPHAYDNIISATIRPPKPPPPSAAGSPTPTFNINDTRPKGRPLGSRNRVLCLPLVDAAIVVAATPAVAPQATLPTPATTRRPRKDTATVVTGNSPVATASATTHPTLPTCAQTLGIVAGTAPSPSTPLKAGFLASSSLPPLTQTKDIQTNQKLYPTETSSVLHSDIDKYNRKLLKALSTNLRKLQASLLKTIF